MAWIFLPGSMLMPAEAPMDKANPALTLGYRTLQVRGRLVSHLHDFIANYMDPYGLGYSEIEVTPGMDYNCRFYARKEDFAQAMYFAMLDINYTKFKEQAERRNLDGTLRYPKGQEYHEVLNSMWSVATRLAPPGGYYGPRSPQNPRGYEIAGERWEETEWERA